MTGPGSHGLESWKQPRPPGLLPGRTPKARGAPVRARSWRRSWVHSSAVDGSNPRALHLGPRGSKVHAPGNQRSRPTTQGSIPVLEGSMADPRSHGGRPSKRPCPASRPRASDLEAARSRHRSNEVSPPSFEAGRRLDRDVNHWSRSLGANPSRGEPAEGQGPLRALRSIAIQSFHAGGPSLGIRACKLPRLISRLSPSKTYTVLPIFPERSRFDGH